MKSLRLLFVLFVLGMMFQSCSDDENDKASTFNADFIKQTNWTGTLVVVVEGQDDLKCGINMLFTTDSRGTYEYTSGLYNFNKDFQYRLDDKLMLIGGNLDTYFTGDWILVDIKTDKMSFKKGLTNKKNYSTLDLVRDSPRNNQPSRPSDGGGRR